MLKNFLVGIFGLSVLILLLISLEVSAFPSIKPSKLVLAQNQQSAISSSSVSSPIQSSSDSQNFKNLDTFDSQNIQNILGKIEKLESSVTKKKAGMPAMEPNGYRDYYDNYQYKNVDNIQISPYIFKNTEADQRIQKIAEERGYKLRHQADESFLVGVEEEYKLQTDAKEGWFELKKAAAKDGYVLGLTSAYRSFEGQRELFLEDFKEKFTPEQIALGEADNYIEQVLTTKAIPGYSKHHTGYTIDIEDRSKSNKPGTLFKDSGAYKWLSANNYANARKYNFLPSYPVGATDIGPAPEAWEYVWVQNLN